jgi:hypothetical protein
VYVWYLSIIKLNFVYEVIFGVACDAADVFDFYVDDFSCFAVQAVIRPSFFVKYEFDVVYDLVGLFELRLLGD